MENILLFVLILFCNFLVFGMGYTAGIKRTCKDIKEIVEKTFNSMSDDTATKE